jgi:hypothetical protein
VTNTPTGPGLQLLRVLIQGNSPPPPAARRAVCKAARDWNSPATAYQINLRRSPIAVIIERFARDRQLFRVYGRYSGAPSSSAFFVSRGGHLFASQNVDKEPQNEVENHDGKAPQKYVATQDKEW